MLAACLRCLAMPDASSHAPDRALRLHDQSVRGQAAGEKCKVLSAVRAVSIGTGMAMPYLPIMCAQPLGSRVRRPSRPAVAWPRLRQTQVLGGCAQAARSAGDQPSLQTSLHS